MKNIIATIIGLSLLSISAAAQARSPYINYEYKGVVPSTTLPNGVKHLGGSLIGDIDADPVYGISWVEKGKTKMLWLEASTGQDSGGVTGWKVLDVLSFPALTRADHLLIGGDPAVSCTERGNEIANLVGVGRIQRRQGVFRPSRLWTANLTTGRFESKPLVNIKCEYSEP